MTCYRDKNIKINERRIHEALTGRDEKEMGK